MVILADDNNDKRIQKLKDLLSGSGIPCVAVKSDHIPELPEALAVFAITTSENHLNTVSIRCGRMPLLCFNESGSRIYNKDVVFYSDTDSDTVERFIVDFIKDKYAIDFEDYIVGNLRFTPTEIRYGINRVKLTAAERRILVLLSLRREIWISEKQIEAVCFDGRSSSCRVPVHICNINKKLKSIAGHRIIKCKRGVGYKAEDNI